MTEGKCKYGLCNGSGFTVTEDNTAVACRCWREKQTLLKLTPELRTAIHIPKTPLYDVQWIDNKNVVQTDKTAENMHLKGIWDDVTAHIRVAIIGKLCDAEWLFPYRIVTDEHLLRVWLGKESYLAKEKSKREDIRSFNSLKDAIGPDYDLVIIRLGHLVHKNAAAANMLQEALMIREAAQKPTWIVEIPTFPFQPGLPVYSDSIHRYIYTRFEIMTFSTVGDSSPRPPPPVERAPVERSVAPIIEDVTLNDDDFDVPGLIKQQSPPKGRRGGHFQ